MTTSAVRPGTLEKLRELRNSPPRVAKIKFDAVPLKTTVLEVETLETQLEEMITMRRVGEGLRAARKRKKLSTRALADQLQISQTRVMNVERANEALELQTIVRFAAQLGYRMAVQFIPDDGNDPAILIPLSAPQPKL